MDSFTNPNQPIASSSLPKNKQLSRRLPPMFAYAGLPPKPSPLNPQPVQTRPPPINGEGVSIVSGLPSRPSRHENGHDKHAYKTTSQTSPSSSALRTPTPTPGPDAMVPYSGYNVGHSMKKATINIWPRSLHPGQERDGFAVKRARSEEDDNRDEDAPLIPVSLAHTRVVTIKADNPADPIPILPPPLLSKRAKKGGASTAVLLPVDKLPVFPLPPLPPISDPNILKQVFTHQSVFPRSRGQFEEIEGQGHYEKLEHVGDSILGMVVTTWLHELKPSLTCGTATKLKAHLVSNATLSHISGMYNLPQRLNGDPRLLPVLRAQTDVRAALVEAYIAGVYFSFPVQSRMTDGFACITDWLREMYDPLYDFFLQHMMNEYSQHYSVMGTAYDGTMEVAGSPEELDKLDAQCEGMALLLKMYGTQKERTIEYTAERFETSVGILWRIRCAVDGVQMGDATRSSRYRARNAAAWEVAKKLGLTTGTA